ncbi:MAG: hypothetical protein WKF87_13235 [Chryseolinea sp.]
MKLKLVTCLVAAFFVTACSDDNVPAQKELTLSLTNLEPSTANEKYEGWLMVNGSPVSTGTFTVNGSKVLSQTVFEIPAATLAAATDFVLSIEPTPDTDPAPSAIKLAGGTFSGNSASVSVAHAAALGNNFASAAGKFILATPTTAATNDELSGVWFLDNSSGTPAVGLTLPILPSGWAYEGWAVINSNPVSSGTFTSVSGSDNNASYSGPASPPPFPGEDFVANAPSGLTFPTNLASGLVVISIEPSPDNNPAPFALKPLLANVSATAVDHVVYNFTNQVSTTFPGGSVSR